MTTTLATIISLVLGLGAAASTTSPTEPTALRGHNLNHNQTLVRDEVALQRSNTSNFQLTTTQTLGPLVLQLFSGFVCSPIVCGSNHNETVVRDDR